MHFSKKKTLQSVMSYFSHQCIDSGNLIHMIDYCFPDPSDDPNYDVLMDIKQCLLLQKKAAESALEVLLKLDLEETVCDKG